MSKVAIVTGAGQGIGFAIAKRLVQDGFKVGVLDYNAETAEKAVAELSAENAFAVVADVSKQAEVAAAFQKVVDHFGDLNVVVNNAGVAPTTPLDTITEEQFERTFAGAAGSGGGRAHPSGTGERLPQRCDDRAVPCPSGAFIGGAESSR